MTNREVFTIVRHIGIAWVVLVLYYNVLIPIIIKLF